MSTELKRPVSGVQKGFLDASGIEETTNIVPAAWGVDGIDHPQQVVDAWMRVVARHEALRMRFGRNADGTWFQVVVDATPAMQDRIIIRDASHLEGVALEAEIGRNTAELLAMPFDLTDAPSWRGRLIRTGRRSWRLVLMFAHVVFDGSSVNVLADDLAAALAGRERPEPLQLIELVRRELAIVPSAAARRFWAEDAALRGTFPRRPWQGGVGGFHIVGVDLAAPYASNLMALTTAELPGRLERGERAPSITTVLGGVAAVVMSYKFQNQRPAIGVAAAQRAAEGVEGSNALLVGPAHDHHRFLAAPTPGQEALAYLIELQRRRNEARRFRLPSGHLAELDGGLPPYDCAINHGRWGLTPPIPAGDGVVLTAMPVHEIGPVNVMRPTTAAPILASITNITPDGRLAGVVTGVTGLFSELEVGDFARRFVRGLELVAQGWDEGLHLGSLMTG